MKWDILIEPFYLIKSTHPKGCGYFTNVKIRNRNNKFEWSSNPKSLFVKKYNLKNAKRKIQELRVNPKWYSLIYYKWAKKDEVE